MTEPPPTTGHLAPAEPTAEVVDGVPVDRSRWERLARAALVAEGAPPDAELSVDLVTEEAMAVLNETHLGHSGPTDVLSFPLDLVEHLAGDPTAGPDSPVGHDGSSTDVPAMAGDIVLCPAVARRNAPDHAGTLDDELALLTVHGVLHLLGHDHAEPGERARMQAREQALLAQLHGPLARDPWAAQRVPS